METYDHTDTTKLRRSLQSHSVTLLEPSGGYDTRLVANELLMSQADNSENHTSTAGEESASLKGEHTPKFDESNHNWGDSCRHILSDTWFPEIASWTFSLGCFLSIISILYKYDGSILPSFPFGITIGALITLFATLSTIALVSVVSNGISQLKWIRFSQRARPTIDLQRYDQASRGIWGSLTLLTTSRQSGLAILGALITIFVIAANAITQQSIGYISKHVIDTEGIALSPQSVSWNSYNSQGFTVDPLAYAPNLDDRTGGALLAGLFHGESKLSRSRPQCSSANCDWDSYKSLGACSAVANMSEQLKAGPSNNLTLPGVGNFPILLTDFDLFIRSTGKPSPYSQDRLTEDGGADISSKAFIHLDNSTIVDFFAVWFETQFNATPSGFNTWYGAAEINVHFCVQELQPEVKNGESSIKIADTVYNRFEYNQGVNLGYYDDRFPYDENIWNKSLTMSARPPDSQDIFRVHRIAQQALLYRSRDLFHGEVMKGFDGFNQVPPRAGNSIGILPLLNAVKGNNTIEKLENIANNIAVALSNRMLAKGEKGTKYVKGTAYRSATFIEVSWPWLSFLAVLIVASLLFLLGVIFLSRVPEHRLWRDSNLALLQALDTSSRPLTMSGMRSNLKMEETAANVHAKLQKRGGTWRLTTIQ